jgi:hypothetical protein
MGPFGVEFFFANFHHVAAVRTVMGVFVGVLIGLAAGGGTLVGGRIAADEAGQERGS